MPSDDSGGRHVGNRESHALAYLAHSRDRVARGWATNSNNSGTRGDLRRSPWPCCFGIFPDDNFDRRYPRNRYRPKRSSCDQRHRVYYEHHDWTDCFRQHKFRWRLHVRFSETGGLCPKISGDVRRGWHFLFNSLEISHSGKPHLASYFEAWPWPDALSSWATGRSLRLVLCSVIDA